MSNAPPPLDRPPPNAVHGDVIIDLDADGMISVWTVSGWMWVTAEDTFSLAATASGRGNRVIVGGDVDSKLGWPIADRLAAVSGATPKKVEGDHPLGWIAVVGIDEHPENPAAVELVERAREVGELDRLVRSSARWCRPRAYEVLSRANGAEPTSRPPDAATDAVSIPYPAYESRWVAGVLAAAFVALIVGGIVVTGGFDGNWFAAAVLVALLAGVLALIAFGSGNRAVCFDGPMIWVRAGRDRWLGPVDLRNIAVYSERTVQRGSLRVMVGEPDPDGKRLRGGDSFPKELRAGIKASDERYRMLSIAVDRTYLMHGLGAYIAPYIDPERCLVGLSAHVLRRQHSWSPRVYDDVPTHRPPS